MSNTTITTTKKTVAKTNTKKVNAKVDYSKLFESLCKCETKHQLVDTVNSFGYRTTTLPTDTVNKNDLYFQFCEKSRLLIGAKSLKFYTCDNIATEFSANYGDEMVFDKVNDGSYRTNRCTMTKSLENFERVFDYFIREYHDNMVLPNKQ